MSQKAAAAAWGVGYTTLCAIEQGKDRNYQSQTLEPYDAVLGRSAWELYKNTPDPEPPDEVRAELDALRDELLGELRAEVAVLRADLIRVAEVAVPAQPVGLAGLLGEMDAAEQAAVAAFVHLILARRRDAG